MELTMPFAAKSSPPDPTDCTYRHPYLSKAAQNPRTIFTCLPGYLDTDCLLATLREQGKRIFWLRLDSEDSDPATFLLTLLQAVQSQDAYLGDDLPERMRRRLGPINGWPPLFHDMANLLTRAMGENGALIFEHVHKLSTSQPTLGLIASHLLPNLPEVNSCIMISHERLPPLACWCAAEMATEKDLNTTVQIGISIARDLGLAIPVTVIQQAIYLLNGRVGALKALFSACDLFGQGFLNSVIQQGHNTSHMLSMILNRWLEIFDNEEIQNLSMCSKIEYMQPDLFCTQPNKNNLIPHPWLQQLSNGWQRVRCLWEAPLRSALRNRVRIDSIDALNLAHRLLEIGAVVQSIRLSIELGDYHTAAMVISDHQARWMDLGQWATLEDFIKQIPESEIKAWPQLLYASCEIAAAQGRIAEARRSLAISSELFSIRGERDKASQSLLAESMLATWEGDKDYARRHAESAKVHAQQAGFADLLDQANWVLASIAVATNELEEALLYLSQPVNRTSKTPMAEVFGQLVDLIRRQLNLQIQRKSQYQTYYESLQAEQNNRVLLNRLLSTPASGNPEILTQQNWSEIPWLLKIPTPKPVSTVAEARPNFLKRLSRIFSINKLERRHRVISGIFNPSDAQPIRVGDFPEQIVSPPRWQPTQPSSPSLTTPLEAVVAPDIQIQPENPFGEVVSAYMLGAFRLSIRDAPLTRLPSSRGLAVLKYMLVNRDLTIPREVLMETFWPDADPESARNSLNVALHSLRQALRLLSPLPLILFDNGKYSTNPMFHFWIDVEEFEHHLEIAIHLERTGQIVEAVQEYEAAISLYRGDFLADDPYEDWTIMTRERQRLAYIDALDHLSQFYFNQGDYSSSATLCQLVLTRDNCQEDAHRRLMRCYSRQGQRHLALRQYQVCVDALRTELDVAPEASTASLAEQIRNQERV